MTSGTLLDWGGRRMKKTQTHGDRQTDKDIGVGWNGLSGRETSGLWKLRMFALCSWIRKQGYYLQLTRGQAYYIQRNKESVPLHTDKQGVGLANLGRSSFHKGSSLQAVIYQRESRKLWWTFSAHTFSIRTCQMKALPLLSFTAPPPGLKEGFVIVLWVWGYGPWYVYDHVNSTPSVKTSSLRCAPHLTV